MAAFVAAIIKPVSNDPIATANRHQTLRCRADSTAPILMSKATIRAITLA